MQVSPAIQATPVPHPLTMMSGSQTPATHCFSFAQASPGPPQCRISVMVSTQVAVGPASLQVSPPVQPAVAPQRATATHYPAVHFSVAAQAIVKEPQKSSYAKKVRIDDRIRRRSRRLAHVSLEIDAGSSGSRIATHERKNASCRRPASSDDGSLAATRLTRIRKCTGNVEHTAIERVGLEVQAGCRGSHIGTEEWSNAGGAGTTAWLENNEPEIID